MTISVEPLAKLVIEQRENIVKGEKYIRPWTTYTAALFATVEGNDDATEKASESISYTYAHTLTWIQMWSLLVEYRRGHLLPLARWAKDLALGSAKLNWQDLPMKQLSTFVSVIIKNYGKAVKDHRALHHGESRPAPDTSNVITKFGIELNEYLADLRQMLYVSSLTWHKDGAIKKCETFIKQTLPFSLCKPDRMRLLATDEGWATRKKLGQIVESAGGVNGPIMTWWDDFTTKPTDITRIDYLDIPENITNESNGNMIICMGRIDEIRAQNQNAVTQVVNLVMVEKLGLLQPGLTSTSILEPLQALCEVSITPAQVFHLLTPINHHRP